MRGVVGQTAGLRVVLKHGSDINSRENKRPLCFYLGDSSSPPRPNREGFHSKERGESMFGKLH